MLRAMLLLLLFAAACTPEEAANTFGRQNGTAAGAADSVADTTASDMPEMPSQEAGADTSWTREPVVVEDGAYATLLDVRTGSHAGFDRIVMSFGNAPLPGYRVEYMDPPVTACGSGATVDLPGTGFLSIRMQPAAAHSEEGNPTVGQRDARFELPVLLGLRLTCDFEADVTWMAALRTPNPYRVFELASPNRIVIDVRHRM